jgi:hypothetical protein
MYQFGVGLAFLATVRTDGGPRVHPICPLIDENGLYAFLVPSRKREDLVRDGRYAMHSFPTDDNEDAAYLTGTATRVIDPETRTSLEAQFRGERTLAERPIGFDAQELFEFDIQRCLCTRTTGHGDPHPHHTVWSARDP